MVHTVLYIQDIKCRQLTKSVPYIGTLTSDTQNCTYYITYKHYEMYIACSNNTEIINNNKSKQHRQEQMNKGVP